MKNTFKLTGIIAIAAVIGLTMAACQEYADNANAPKYIELTGITIDANTVRIEICSTSAAEDVKAYAYGDVSGSKTAVKLPLVSNTAEKQYTGTGKWYISLTFELEPSGTKTYYYRGNSDSLIPLQYDIQNETSSIPFNEFFEKTN